LAAALLVQALARAPFAASLLGLAFAACTAAAVVAALLVDAVGETAPGIQAHLAFDTAGSLAFLKRANAKAVVRAASDSAAVPAAAPAPIISAFLALAVGLAFNLGLFFSRVGINLRHLEVRSCVEQVRP